MSTNTENQVEQTETKAKKEKAPKVEKPKQPEQNGVTRPGEGTTTGRVWAIADQLSAAANKPATRKEVMDVAKAEGINEATVATQYGKWRKFHGLKAEVREAKPKVEKKAKAKKEEAAPAAPAAE